MFLLSSVTFFWLAGWIAKRALSQPHGWAFQGYIQSAISGFAFAITGGLAVACLVLAATL